MKAMILAAGFGNRMRPLSDRCPKPLLPVLGRPLIDYLIEHLKTISIKKIGVNIHHWANKMEAYLKDGSQWGVEIIISREKEVLGTGGGMEAMRHFLSDEGPFLVYNGDILSDIDLNELIRFHFYYQPLVTMALYDYPPINNVTLSSEGKVVDFLGKRGVSRAEKDKNLTFTGISIVDPSVFDFIPRAEFSSIIDVYLNLLDQWPGCIQGYTVQGKYWIDIGTPTSYLQVHKDILLNGKTVLPLKRFQGMRVYKGVGTIIEPGGKLEGFVSVGKNCIIRKRAFLKNCVVWDNTEVKEGVYLENGVMDGEWKHSIFF
ncbi:MAG: hypothetical protein DRG25_03835 [Deltaproteobacteria bacterium]|nr:MAG: hypothetical protein DRG25_03835 [Deltaproteobacteria bacterium]